MLTQSAYVSYISVSYISDSYISDSYIRRCSAKIFWALPLGFPSGSGDILLYIPPLVTIQF